MLVNVIYVIGAFKVAKIAVCGALLAGCGVVYAGCKVAQASIDVKEAIEDKFNK